MLCLSVLTLSVFLKATDLFDAWVVQAIYEARDTFGLIFFSSITRLADTWTILFILGLASVVLLISNKDRAWILGLLVSVAGAKISEIAIKIFIGRERPGDFALLDLDTFSFPSGHATVALALYGFIAYLLWQHYPRLRSVILGTAVALVALIGMSRVYIGVHYPSDVLGGYLLGSIWVLCGIWAVRYWRS